MAGPSYSCSCPSRLREEDSKHGNCHQGSPHAPASPAPLSALLSVSGEDRSSETVILSPSPFQKCHLTRDQPNRHHIQATDHAALQGNKVTLVLI